MARMVEIDEDVLQRSTKAREFIEAIWNNPKAKRKLLEAQKEVKPDDPLVKELEKPDPVEETKVSLSKEIADLKKEIAEREAKREQDEKLALLKRQRDDGISTLRKQGWTDKGIEGVSKIMEEKGILDPMDAAAIWEKANPPQTPISPVGSQSWNFTEPPTGTDNEDYIKKLFDSQGKNDLIAEKRAMEALMEVRGR